MYVIEWRFHVSLKRIRTSICCISNDLIFSAAHSPFEIYIFSSSNNSLFLGIFYRSMRDICLISVTHSQENTLSFFAKINGYFNTSCHRWYNKSLIHMTCLTFRRECVSTAALWPSVFWIDYLFRIFCILS